MFLQVYHHEQPEMTHSVDFNKGDEASAYVSYIIENYEALPEIMIFMHAHE